MDKPGSEAIADKPDLFEACKEGNIEVVRKLVNQSTVNSRDTGGRKSTPLHFAAGTSPMWLYSLYRISLLNNH